MLTENQIKEEIFNSYLKEISPPFLDFYLKNKEWFETARHKNHVGSQKSTGGLKLHTMQVINMALHLNQKHDRKEIIECCLIHDIRGCEELPLTEAQRLAIRATKGAKHKEWRHTNHYQFVCLILISDMWSAYLNEKDLM
jgi:hypothetical protein